MHVDVGEGPTVVIGDHSVQISPGEAFRLAEKLIRSGTVAMIEEETEGTVGRKPVQRAVGAQ
jgi:hypothetical protein